MKWKLVKRKGKTLIRITVGGKSKTIRKTEKRLQKRAIEIRKHFEKVKIS